MQIKSFFLLLALLIITSACSSDEHAVMPQLTVDTQSIEVGCDQKTFTVNVSSNVVWSAASTESWIRIQPAFSECTDGSLTVTIMPNAGMSRNGFIYLYAGLSDAIVAAISVSQNARDKHVAKTSNRIIALNSEDRISEIEVENVPHGWTFDILEGSAWMEVLKTPRGLKIEADPLTVLWRCGIISVETLDDTFNIYVVQADFRRSAICSMQTAYYGSLDDSKYSIGLLAAQTDVYDAPYVGQQYQDSFFIQFNIEPMAESFSDFSLREGRYSFLTKDPGISFCTAGFVNENNEVYGSCMMRKWWYQGQEYGMYGSVIQEGFVFVKDNTDGSTTFYIVGNGCDLSGSKENYAWELTDVNIYVNMLEDEISSFLPKHTPHIEQWNNKIH